MKFPPFLSGRTETDPPGVFELKHTLLNRVRVLSMEAFQSAERERQEQLGARTEILFHQLYDWIATQLALEFYVPLQLDDNDATVLSRIASNAKVELVSQDDRSAEVAADQIVWRNAARATALVLFDRLGGYIEELGSQSEADPSIRWSDTEWVDGVLTDSRFNPERFTRASGLVKDEIPKALRVAARAVTEWERFQAPGEYLRYRGVSLFVLGDEGSNKFQAVKTEAPTIAFLEGEPTSTTDDSWVFSPGVMIMAVASPLYYELKSGEKVITVAAGDGDAVAPTPLRVSLTIKGARPTTSSSQRQSRQVQAMSFAASADGASVAFPRDEVKQLTSSTFLLQSRL